MHGLCLLMGTLIAAVFCLSLFTSIQQAALFSMHNCLQSFFASFQIGFIDVCTCCLHIQVHF